MKNIVFISILLIFSLSEGYSQNVNTVVITTIGSGSNFENAKVNALRSALEQVSGAYLTANTLIINDKLISDNISTITTGSINKYEVLGQIVSNNQVFVTIKSEILPNKFADFVTGKTGSSVTVKGGLYAENIKQLNLNEKAELEAVKKLSDLYNDLLFASIYYNLNVKAPVENKKKLSYPEQLYILSLDVTMRFNALIDSANNYLKNNLKQICLKESEILAYNTIPREVYSIKIDETRYYFRNPTTPIKILKIDKFKTNIDYIYSYTINDGIKKYQLFYSDEQSSLHKPVIFINNKSDFKNLYYSSYNWTVKGFNGCLCNQNIVSEYLSNEKYPSEYLCRLNFFGKSEFSWPDLRFIDEILLWDSNTSFETRLDGYYTLKELELINKIEITKNKSPYFTLKKINEK